MRYQKIRSLIAIALVLLLLGCGGGSVETDSSNDPKPILNSAPVISVNSPELWPINSDFEIDASATVDADNDSLLYELDVVNGIDVEITSSSPGVFSVKTTSIVMQAILLRLLVNDGSESVQQDISVTLYNRNSAKNQLVIAEKPVLQLGSENTATFDYSLYNHGQQNVAGLVLDLYWNSSLVTLDEFIANQDDSFIALSVVKLDENNLDNDSLTDSFVTLGWLDSPGGTWIAEATEQKPLLQGKVTWLSENEGSSMVHLLARSSFPIDDVDAISLRVEKKD